MAKVIIMIEDDVAGSVDFKTKFDPPVTSNATCTAAQSAALFMLQSIATASEQAGCGPQRVKVTPPSS